MIRVSRCKIQKRGFTAIEMLLVVAFIIILLGIVTITFRDQGPKNRNSERRNEVNAIANALTTWSFDNNTPFGAITPQLPTTATCIGTQTTPTVCYNLTSFLIPQYLNSIPEDPKNTNGQADTGYTIYRETFVDGAMTKTKEIIIGAPMAENMQNGETIEARRK